MGYVLPTLRDDVQLLARVFDHWRPDVVVTGSFSPAARIAAHLHGLPRVEVTIYPQHRHHLARTQSFGLALRKATAELAGGAGGLGDDVTSALAWGVGGDAVLLHDRAILGGLDGVGEVVGFPYWDDGLAERPGDRERVDAWLDAVPRPVLAVTLGSFLGVAQRRAWTEAADAIRELGVSAVFVGPRGHWDDAALEARSDVLTAGFVPLSGFAARVDAVVHHGGVGTMFGALRAGRPAVVIPQAFDQPFNADLVQRAGVGVDASGRSLTDALDRVLREPRFTARARAVAASLIPVEDATERAVKRIIQPLTKQTATPQPQ